MCLIWLPLPLLILFYWHSILLRSSCHQIARVSVSSGALPTEYLRLTTIFDNFLLKNNWRSYLFIFGLMRKRWIQYTIQYHKIQFFYFQSWYTSISQFIEEKDICILNEIQYFLSRFRGCRILEIKGISLPHTRWIRLRTYFPLT